MPPRNNLFPYSNQVLGALDDYWDSFSQARSSDIYSSGILAKIMGAQLIDSVHGFVTGNTILTVRKEVTLSLIRCLIRLFVSRDLTFLPVDAKDNRFHRFNSVIFT